jgi:GxxExxY protein
MTVSQDYAHKQLTSVIIGAAMEVHRMLGSGFLEKVYENALVMELRDRGLKVEQQKAITVFYKNRVAGEYIADIIVEGVVILELKTVEHLTGVHQAQMLNYLKATKSEVGLLFNFHGQSLGWKRVVLQTKQRLSNPII